jgi:hypothetical protein
LNKKIPKAQRKSVERRRIDTHKKENKQQEECEYSNNNDNEDDNYQSNPIKKY